MVLKCVRRLAQHLLKGQPLPKHVAFIMDGNRRFADRLSLQRIDGHKQGYDQMKRILQWCIELGIECISVYAFSIENFRRPPDEVDSLMQLAELKFEELIHDKDAKQWGAELRVIGDLSRAPPSVQKMAARLMKSSKDQHGQARAIINLCFCYTSSQELQHAVQEVCSGMQQCELLPDDVTSDLLHLVMHTRDSPPVDLLVRTSGEQRLSDFLLWQGSHALLHWERCLWPDFGYAQLLKALLAWQEAAPQLDALRTAAAEAIEDDATMTQLTGGSGACSPPPCPWSGQAAAAGAVQLPDAVANQLAQQLKHKLQQQQQQQQVQQQVQPQPEPQPLSPSLQTVAPSTSPFAEKQQPKKSVWWGGLFSTTNGGWGTSSSWSCSQQQQQQQQQPSSMPSIRSPDAGSRAASMSLSMISEEEAVCCPHPSRELRVDNYLRRLAEEYNRRLQVLAA